MARISIPLDALTSRLNFGERFQSIRVGSLGSRFANLRPISEFLDFKRISKPANFAEMQSRVNYNLSHYSSNYAVVFVMLSIYALLTNWLLLFDIILVVIGMWFIGRLDGQDLEIGNFRATSSQLYTGLLVVAIPLGLIASPFTTLLWLIGATGVTILGHASFMDKPIDEAFSGEADGGAAQYEYWDNEFRVEELETEGDDDSDAPGVGSALQRGRRFVSDPLEFTGTDLGDRGSGVVRHRHQYQDTEDEDESSSDGEDEDEDLDDGDGQLVVSDKEEALVQRALYRISKAQAKGRTDVKLNKEELAALERRRERLEEEERRNRKKRKEQRVAVPLAHFESMSRSAYPPRHDSLSRQASGNASDSQDNLSAPPMGYFPPPSSSRSRPRSTASTSRPASVHEDSLASNNDPFRYQTAGPRTLNALSSRNGSGQSVKSYASRRGRPGSVAGWSQQGSRRQSSDDTSEDQSGSSEDTSRSREIVVEVEPEQRSEPGPASSRTRSAAKKKPSPPPLRSKSTTSSNNAGGSSAGARRKKK